MKTFVKPSGIEIEVNENSYAAAKALGWVPKDELQAVVNQVDQERDALAERAKELGISVGNKKTETLKADIEAAEKAAQ